MATTAATAAPHPSVSFGSVLKAVLIGGVVAAVANSILWVLASVLNIPLIVMSGPPGTAAPPGPLPLALVIIVSLLPAVIGGLLYFVLNKVSVKGSMIFLIIAVVVLFLSFLSPFAQPMGIVGQLVLVLMHIIAAATITGSLLTRAPASA